MKTQKDTKEEIEPKEEIVTDSLCYKFTIPLFVAIFMLFIIVIIKGSPFSFVHPPDDKGFHCGIDNGLYGARNKDYSKLPYLGLNGTKSVCLRRCDGTPFVSYCIPKHVPRSKKVPIIFKVVDDFLGYWYYIILFTLLTVALALPAYFICSKYADILFSLSLFCSIIVTVGVALFSLKSGDVFSFLTLICSIALLVSAFLYYRRRVSSITPIIYTAMVYLKEEPKTFLVIPILIASFIIASLFSITGVLFSLGIGDAKISFGKMSVEKHGSLIFTAILFIIIGQWIHQFLCTLMKMSISKIIIKKYYKQKVPTLFEASKTILKYHTGTVFIGSLICYLLDDIAFAINRLKKYAEETENKYARRICRIILSFSMIITKIAGDANRIAFVFTSLNGSSFWDSCKEALDSIIDPKFAILEIIIHDVFWFIRICISCAFSSIAYTISDSIELFKPYIFILIMYFTTYRTIAAIECAMFAACEALLVCVREDARENGSQNNHAPPILWEVVGMFASSKLSI